MTKKIERHEVQMRILRELLFTQSASFSELQKSTGLTSDHFTFHLKQLVDDGFAQKSGDAYTLTFSGKEYANRMDTDERHIEKQAKVSVLLIVENDEGKFLSQQRLKQPYYGFWGRMSGKVRWGETLELAARRELKEETGLTADFRYGGLYHKMDYTKDGQLLEDKYFMLMYGTNPRGDFVVNGEGFHNEFLSLKELAKKDKVFQTVPEVTDAARSGKPTLLELRHEYETEEY